MHIALPRQGPIHIAQSTAQQSTVQSIQHQVSCTVQFTLNSAVHSTVQDTQYNGYWTLHSPQIIHASLPV